MGNFDARRLLTAGAKKNADNIPVTFRAKSGDKFAHPSFRRRRRHDHYRGLGTAWPAPILRCFKVSADSRKETAFFLNVYFLIHESKIVCDFSKQTRLCGFSGNDSARSFQHFGPSFLLPSRLRLRLSRSLSPSATLRLFWHENHRKWDKIFQGENAALQCRTDFPANYKSTKIRFSPNRTKSL